MRWSKKEIEILQEYYPTGGSPEIMKRLPHRKRNLIHCKVRSLGIRYNDYIEPIPQELANNLILTDTEYQVMLGSLLGDGHLPLGRGNLSRLRINHTIKQKEYLLWKSKLIARLMPHIREEIKTNRISLSTRLFKCILKLRREWYPNLVKIIPKSVNYLEPLGLAIWYMDDGWVSNNHYHLATCGFSLSDLSILQSLLNDKFEIQTIIRANKILYIRAESRNNLISLVRGYIEEVPCMIYKLGPARY